MTFQIGKRGWHRFVTVEMIDRVELDQLLTSGLLTHGGILEYPVGYDIGTQDAGKGIPWWDSIDAAHTVVVHDNLEELQYTAVILGLFRYSVFWRMEAGDVKLPGLRKKRYPVHMIETNASVGTIMRIIAFVLS